MPAHKITLSFASTVGAPGTSGARAGWTESWYDPNNGDLPTAVRKANAYVQKRRGLLTSGWTVEFVRVSTLDVNNNPLRRGTLVNILPANGFGRYNIVAVGNDEQPYDAQIVPVNSFSGATRKFLMRGIGNDVINAGGRFLNPPPYIAAFQNWLGFINGLGVDGVFGPLAIKLRSKTAEGIVTQVYTTVQGGVPGTPRTPAIQLTITNIPPNVIAVGNTIVLRNMGVSGLNGSWLITQTAIVGGTGLVLLAPKRRTVINNIPVGGQPSTGSFTTYSYSLDNIVLASPGNGTSRRTGRPSLLPRGRRSIQQL